MSYEKQNFTVNQILKAEHLNHIEDGIENIEQTLDGKSNKLFYNDTEKEVGLTFSSDDMNFVTEDVEMGVVAYNINRAISLNTQTTYDISIEYKDGSIEKFNSKPIILQTPDGGYATVIQIAKYSSSLEKVIMIISGAKYDESISINDMAPMYDPNYSAFAFMGTNAQNFKSFTLIGPSQFEINNTFFNEYKFVTEEEKRRWNSSAYCYDTRELEHCTINNIESITGNVIPMDAIDMYEMDRRYVKVADIDMIDNINNVKNMVVIEKRDMGDLGEGLVYYSLNSLCEMYPGNSNNNLFYFDDAALVVFAFEDNAQLTAFDGITATFTKGIWAVHRLKYVSDIEDGANAHIQSIDFDIYKSGELVGIDEKYLASKPGSSVEEGKNCTFYCSDNIGVVRGIAKKGAETFNDTDVNVAAGMYSHVEGSENGAFGDMSHVEGHFNLAEGLASHAEGYGTHTVAEGTTRGAHAEGYKTAAAGYGAHAEGYVTTVSGSGTHAEGEFSEAAGNGAHAEGYGTTTEGYGTHAEGIYTTSTGDGAHSEGLFATSNGSGTHAEGVYTIANGEGQHVQGRLNLEDAAGNYAHIVGNGNLNSMARSNAHTLDWNGNAWFAGKVTANGYPTADNDLVNKHYVDTLAANSAIMNISYMEEIDAYVEESNIHVLDHKYQRVNMFNNATIIFPEVDSFTKIHLYFDTTEDLVINLPDCRKKQLPEILANKSYELIATYNMNYWLVEINVFE